jgi:hypothetical protein
MFSSTIPSVKVVRSIEVVRDQIARLHRSMMPAPAVMMELVTGAWVAQAIVAAADLGIADALADRPMSPTSWRRQSTQRPTRSIDCSGH